MQSPLRQMFKQHSGKDKLTPESPEHFLECLLSSRINYYLGRLSEIPCRFFALFGTSP